MSALLAHVSPACGAHAVWKRAAWTSVVVRMQVVALGNLLPADAATDELDSWMFQTVGHQLVEAYAACTGLPLLRRRIRGSSRNTVRNSLAAELLTTMHDNNQFCA